MAMMWAAVSAVENRIKGRTYQSGGNFPKAFKLVLSADKRYQELTNNIFSIKTIADFIALELFSSDYGSPEKCLTAIARWDLKLKMVKDSDSSSFTS